MDNAPTTPPPYTSEPLREKRHRTPSRFAVDVNEVLKHKRTLKKAIHVNVLSRDDVGLENSIVPVDVKPRRPIATLRVGENASPTLLSRIMRASKLVPESLVQNLHRAKLVNERALLVLNDFNSCKDGEFVAERFVSMHEDVVTVKWADFKKISKGVTSDFTEEALKTLTEEFKTRKVDQVRAITHVDHMLVTTTLSWIREQQITLNVAANRMMNKVSDCLDRARRQGALEVSQRKGFFKLDLGYMFPHTFLDLVSDSEDECLNADRQQKSTKTILDPYTGVEERFQVRWLLRALHTTVAFAKMFGEDRTVCIHTTSEGLSYRAAFVAGYARSLMPFEKSDHNWKVLRAAGLTPCEFDMQVTYSGVNGENASSITELNDFLSTAKTQEFAVIDDKFINSLRVFHVIRKRDSENDHKCTWVKLGKLVLWGHCGWVPAVCLKLEACSHFNYREGYNIKTHDPMEEAVHLYIRFFYADTASGLFEAI